MLQKKKEKGNPFQAGPSHQIAVTKSFLFSRKTKARFSLSQRNLIYWPQAEMEAVAVSAINLGVKSVAIAIRDEIGLQLGVQEELFFIKNEQEMMQAFLRTASTENVKSEIEATLIRQVQELTSDLENCLQEASVLQMKQEVKEGN